MRDIKKHFLIFVNCSLDKPRFDNQSKTRLNSPQPSVEVKPAAITKLSKWKFLTVMKESLKLKDMLSLKNETERKRGTTRIEGLDDANYAGKSGKSQDCILCIAEGQFVNTGYNSMKIEDFKTYDGKVVSFCDKENSLIKSKVLNFFEKGEKKCVKVTFEDGRTLICTPEHKLLNENNEWIEAKDSKNINIKFGYTSPSCGVDLDFTWELKIKNVVFNLKTIENYNKSGFCKKTEVKKVFAEMIHNVKCKYLFLSYNNEGLLSFEELKEILVKKGDVKLYKIQYTKFKAQQNVDKKYVEEYIWFID
jgi:hypothetical protein